MLERLSTTLIIIVSVVLISLFDRAPSTKESNLENRVLLDKADQASNELRADYLDGSAQNGYSIFKHDGYILTQKYIQQQIQRKYGQSYKAHYSSYWIDSSKGISAMSAYGTDYKHHIANSYLVGIRPFAVDNDWLPLYLLAQRKTYQLDQKQYNVIELWQNSAQAFKNLRGDCEDHAIALADWLISEGLDARVVLGTYKDGGHAWVVVFKDDQVYLLEATSKRLSNSWSHYPLAKLARNYKASFMFNRDSFWRANQKQTRNYDENNWKLVSTFHKGISNISDGT